MELTARATPDGYTLGVNTTAHAINAGRLPDLAPPDGETDFYFVPAGDPEEAVVRIVDGMPDMLRPGPARLAEEGQEHEPPRVEAGHEGDEHAE